MDKIGLYIHWPYCARICPYCDFNIYKNKADTETPLVQAILLDMHYWREMSGPRNLVSIHFGGGTPSLLSAANLQKTIETAQELWSPSSDLEIGLEANPKDITEKALAAWCDAGIERLSVGVQSFDDSALQFLGRDHDGQTAKRALELATNIIPRVSADLIYGFTNQTPNMLQNDLQIVLDSGVSHISTYQLTIEQKTAFGQAEKRGINKAVGSDTSADLFEQVIATLTASGFNQYEVSNFAKKNAQSRHNLLYWQGGDYAGIGPGAHGRLTVDGKRRATIAALKPKDYIASVNSKGHGMAEQETLSPKSWAEEYVLMGMRILGGISLARYGQISGNTLPAETIRQYEKSGLLKKTEDQLSATPKGRMVLDTLCHELLSY
ncbi:MAG: radical SAM family heme chaperone HemW [Robiginitomaculum sp.]|nr:radical SAM family heme chaperone HemW [Robiginitomaculum sp.]